MLVSLLNLAASRASSSDKHEANPREECLGIVTLLPEEADLDLLL